MFSTRRSSTKRQSNSTPSPATSPRKQAPPHKRTRSSKKESKPNFPRRPQEPERDGGSNLQITEHTGDIFSAPPNTLLIHACNCDGSWGAGIAAAFRTRYPKAYEIYRDHCLSYEGELLQTAHLIPPIDAFEAEPTKPVDTTQATPDDALQFNLPEPAPTQPQSQPRPAKHFIGCLFTSRHFGRRRDSPARILAATAPAMVDLLRQVRRWNAEAEQGEEIREVRMCRINSGLFAVPWGRTRGVLEEINVERSDVKVVRVFSPRGS